MSEQSPFEIRPKPFPWRGGEPRVFAVGEEEQFPGKLSGAKVIDISYRGGGLTALLDEITSLAGVSSGSFQAVLENLEDLSHEKPLVVVVRGAERLLADVGPAVMHLMTGWEEFAHHANGISDMYLVLETGPSAITQSAFYPGGIVDWHPK